MLEALYADVRFAFRMVSKNPGFVVVAVLMLAVGIGVNAAVFRVTDAILFRGFPLVQRNDRLLYIANSYGCCVSYPDFADWRAQAKSFSDMAVVHGIALSVRDRDGATETFAATEISAGTFKLVGQKPILGRDFMTADEAVGAAPVAILRYEFWEHRFGKDP